MSLQNTLSRHGVSPYFIPPPRATQHGLDEKGAGKRAAKLAKAQAKLAATAAAKDAAEKASVASPLGTHVPQTELGGDGQ